MGACHDWCGQKNAAQAGFLDRLRPASCFAESHAFQTWNEGSLVMPIYHSAAARARKERQAAEDAVRARLMKQRLDQRIGDLKAKHASAPVRSMNGENRRWPRTPAYKVATAVLDTGAEVTCRIVDVSFGGMRIEFLDESVRPGEFGLTVPTLRFVGIVQNAWTRGAQTGVEVVRWRESA
ncbi:MAG TPA: hypothetical protein DEA50_09160 [Parvularcula sp.]|nr:hypothetical protein [Parvularcula sp.]